MVKKCVLITVFTCISISSLLSLDKLSNSPADFKTKVLQSSKPVIVEVSAHSCGACRGMIPVVKQVEQRLRAQVQMFELDFYEGATVRTQLGVQTIPTFIYFKDGKEITRHIGGATVQNLVNKAKTAFNITV